MSSYPKSSHVLATGEWHPARGTFFERIGADFGRSLFPARFSSDSTRPLVGVRDTPQDATCVHPLSSRCGQTLFPIFVLEPLRGCARGDMVMDRSNTRVKACGASGIPFPACVVSSMRARRRRCMALVMSCRMASSSSAGAGFCEAVSRPTNPPPLSISTVCGRKGANRL